MNDRINAFQTGSVQYSVIRIPKKLVRFCRLGPHQTLNIVAIFLKKALEGRSYETGGTRDENLHAFVFVREDCYETPG